MKKLLCFSLLMFTVFAFSQVDVTGKVTMGEAQEPVAFAEVSSVENPSESTFTDEEGNFSITLSAGEGNLTVFGVNGEETVIPYKGGQVLAITLEQAILLDDLVAIGYGKVKKSDLSTAVTNIENIETIESRPVTNVAEFLQGQAAGVTVTSQGGDPSAMPKIVIRGLGTINNQSVLYVVDGLPYYGSAINPNDIKSISVLKDAASAAIYGAQASGGVIIIETKKGKKGKPKVELNMFTGFQETPNLPTPLTSEQRNKAYTQAFENDGLNAPNAYDANQNPWGAVTRTNWIDEVFRSAAINEVNAGISGAAENVNYYTSLEYLNKEGVLLGTNFKRYSARGKVDIDLSDKWKAGANLLYSQTEAIGTNTTSGTAGVLTNAIWMPSAAPVYDKNGEFHGTVPQELASDFSGAYGDVYNPVALLLRPSIKDPLKNFNGQGYLSFEPIKNLTIKTSLGYNTTNRKFKRFDPRIPEVGRTNAENFLTEAHYNTESWIWDNQLKYNFSLQNHNFDVTLVHSAQEAKIDNTRIKVKNFDIEQPYNQFIEFANDVVYRRGDKAKTRMTSAIGRLMYDYDKRYYLSGSIRRDETSKANPTGDFQVKWSPGVSAAWRISNEPFFNVNSIDQLKLRASWGELPNVQSLKGAYSFTANMNQGLVVLGENGTLSYPGIWLNESPSPTVTWESVESFDVGLDFGLLKKVTGVFDYYKKTTKGIILRAARNDMSGLNPRIVNGATAVNKGFEVSLNYNDTFGGVDLGVGVNLNKNNNELTDLNAAYRGGGGDANDVISVSDNVREQLYPFSNQIGQPIFSYHLIQAEGIFQTQAEIDAHAVNGQLIQPNAKPGDLKFRDINGDGVINDDDRVFSGSYNPDFTYAFNFNLGYKGFDFSAFFQGISGVKVFNAYKFTTYNSSFNFNLDNEVLNAWTPNNTNTDIPRLSHEDKNKNYQTNSTWYLENGSYLRLKNITLGYDFSRFVSKLASKARIYITAENVFTITKYSGTNPEVGGKGLDNGKYPLARTISMGATFNF